MRPIKESQNFKSVKKPLEGTLFGCFSLQLSRLAQEGKADLSGTTHMPSSLPGRQQGTPMSTEISKLVCTEIKRP